jgi:hypothetical protein
MDSLSTNNVYINCSVLWLYSGCIPKGPTSPGVAKTVALKGPGPLHLESLLAWVGRDRIDTRHKDESGVQYSPRLSSQVACVDSGYTSS